MIAFRLAVVRRRSEARLEKVLDRIHVLEGRSLVLLNIDRVIAIIRNADDPKADLIKEFGLTDRQADDILEIRLKQLARLAAIAIEKELAQLCQRTCRTRENSRQRRRTGSARRPRKSKRRQEFCRSSPYGG